jgi:hypothetical protein
MAAKLLLCQCGQMFKSFGKFMEHTYQGRNKQVLHVKIKKIRVEEVKKETDDD